MGGFDCTANAFPCGHRTQTSHATDDSSGVCGLFAYIPHIAGLMLCCNREETLFIFIKAEHRRYNFPVQNKSFLIKITCYFC